MPFLFGIIRFAIGLVLAAAFIWFGTSVPLGEHTLFGHVGRIWKAEETQDLVKGTKEAAEPAVKKVKKGVEAGFEAARAGDEDGGVDPTPGRPRER